MLGPVPIDDHHLQLVVARSAWRGGRQLEKVRQRGTSLLHRGNHVRVACTNKNNFAFVSLLSGCRDRECQRTDSNCGLKESHTRDLVEEW